MPVRPVEDDPGFGERLAEALNVFNYAAAGRDDGADLDFVVEEAGEMIAGLSGYTWAGIAEVKVLWVRDDQRGNGLGTSLLAAAEAEVRRRGGDRVTLNTYSFQAPGFYARHGYAECGRTLGYPSGHDHIHLVKRLQ